MGDTNSVRNESGGTSCDGDSTSRSWGQRTVPGSRAARRRVPRPPRSGREPATDGPPGARSDTGRDGGGVPGAQATVPVRRRHESARRRSIRVLLVDDGPEFAEVAAEVLEREADRFSVATARSASEGLEVLATGEIDCVVSDYEMPGLNGIEFFEVVRADYPDVPFILFTSKDRQALPSGAVPDGSFEFLRKSPCPEQLYELVDRVDRAVVEHDPGRAAERYRRDRGNVRR